MREFKPNIWATYAAAQAVIGTNMLAHPEAFNTTTYSRHIDLMPLQWWGAGFVAAGALGVAARFEPIAQGRARRWQFSFARAVAVSGALLWGGWAFYFLPALLLGGWSSLNPVVLWGLAAAAPLMDLHRSIRRSRE